MSFGQHVAKLRLVLRRRFLSKSFSRRAKIFLPVWICLLLWAAVSIFFSWRRHGDRQTHRKEDLPAGHSNTLSQAEMTAYKRTTPTVDEALQTSSLFKMNGPSVESLGAACFTDKCGDGLADSRSSNTTILIGVISDAELDVEFRTAARATWLATAKGMEHVQAVFFFPAPTEALQQEADQCQDIAFGSNRHPAMPVAYQMLEHFVEKHDALHILRVDVRSYVSVPRLLAKLQQVCFASDCRGEDIWAGRQITNKEITHDRHYQEETGLSSYLPYMSSGAYVISMSLAASLSLMHNEIGLKHIGDEDVSLGLWLIPMATRRIDLGTAVHLEKSCCFDSWGRIKVDICDEHAEQLPIVLSVLSDPQYLHKYHDAIATCSR